MLVSAFLMLPELLALPVYSFASCNFRMTAASDAEPFAKTARYAEAQRQCKQFTEPQKLPASRMLWTQHSTSSKHGLIQQRGSHLLEPWPACASNLLQDTTEWQQ